MEDFASASMLRLLLRGMAAVGLAAPFAEPRGAHAQLAHKQALVSRIVHAGGLGLLLKLARGVQHIDGEPLHRALIGAGDPHEFLLRWQRLERYVHTSHRVFVVDRGPRSLGLQHRSVNGAPAPLAAESVAVLGAWIGALEAIGTVGLTVRMAGIEVHPTAGREGALDAASDAATWSLRWHSVRATADDAAPATAFSAMPLPWGPQANALARRLARDPAQSLNLPAAAAALGMSARTLQRRLAQQGASFSTVVAQARMRLAALWLAQTRHGLAEIGYGCGYADQPHFTREFTRWAGLSPARYRAAIAPGADGGHGNVSR